MTSSEVKKRLHEFVISKKQKDHAIASLSGAQAFKHWLVQSDFVAFTNQFCKKGDLTILLKYYNKLIKFLTLKKFPLAEIKLS